MAVNYDIFLLGLGGVGSQFLRDAADDIRNGALPARVVGFQDSGGYLFNQNGFPQEALRCAADYKFRDGQPTHKKLVDYSPPFAHVKGSGTTRLLDHSRGLKNPWIVVDATSDDTLDLLTSAYLRGSYIVSANKIPYASLDGLRNVDQLLQGAFAKPRRVYLRATAGADIGVTDAMIKALQEMDKAPLERAIAMGIASGTNQFICTGLQEGRSFVDILQDACDKGYTESRPYDDLSGKDVLRKATIIARIIAQYAGVNLRNIHSALRPCAEGIFSDEFASQVAELGKEQFMEAVRKAPGINEKARQRVNRVSSGKVLRYMFTVDYDSSEGIYINVGLEEASKTDTNDRGNFGRLISLENLFEISLGSKELEGLKGPGAGIKETSEALRRNIRMIAGLE